MRSRDGESVHGLDETMTTPLRKPGSPDRPGYLGRCARGFTGALTAGLVLLALGIVVAQFLINEPGPGTPVVILHLVGAGVAVILQVLADRTRGGLGVLCMFGVLCVASGVLWFGWYQ